MLRDMNGRAREECSGGSSGDDDNICRDFLRNVCRRGKRCKFRHPDSSGEPTAQQNNTTSGEGKAELTFCHDYQNGQCTRPVCRFIHCTSKDEDSYYQSGDIPPPILDQAIRKGQLGDITLNGDVPICKDFLSGDCTRRRGGKCKFRHLNVREYEEEIYGPASRDGTRDREGSFGGTSVPYRDMNPGVLNSHYDHLNAPDRIPNLPSPDPKRQRRDPEHHPHDFQREGDFMIPLDEMGREVMSRDISLREFRDRERERDKERDRRGLEELLILRKQIDGLKKENSSLKKEVSDLRATNEFLLDQVTTLRLSKAGGSMAVTMPTVSLASAIPVATSVQPLTAGLSQPMPITSDGSVVALPPQARAPPQAQAQQQAQGPPSQAVTVVPQGASAVVGSIAGVAVSLPQVVSTVSLNPQMSTSMTCSIPSAQNMSQAISMSGATGHLVTYPIMTQPGLRPQLQ